MNNIFVEFYMLHEGRLITEFVEFSEECINKIRLNSFIKNFFLEVDTKICITPHIFIRVNKNFAKIWNKGIKEVKKVV